MAYHRSPSRIKYEKAHPNVTIRLSKDFKEFLTSISLATGKSFPALIREGLEHQILSKIADKPVSELSQEQITLLIQKLESMIAEIKKPQVKIG